MMELSLKHEALEWIDAMRGDKSRQGFIRELIYKNINATSGEENNAENLSNGVANASPQNI